MSIPVLKFDAVIVGAGGAQCPTGYRYQPVGTGGMACRTDGFTGVYVPNSIGNPISADFASGACPAGYGDGTDISTGSATITRCLRSCTGTPAPAPAPAPSPTPSPSPSPTPSPAPTGSRCGSDPDSLFLREVFNTFGGYGAGDTMCANYATDNFYNPTTERCIPHLLGTGQEDSTVSGYICRLPTPPPPIDCEGSWGSCSAPCGGGNETFNVTIQPANGGRACPISPRSCNMQACVPPGSCVFRHPMVWGTTNSAEGSFTCIEYFLAPGGQFTETFHNDGEEASVRSNYCSTTRPGGCNGQLTFKCENGNMRVGREECYSGQEQ